MITELAKTLTVAASEQTASADRRAALERYGTQIDRLGGPKSTADGGVSLETVCRRIQQALWQRFEGLQLDAAQQVWLKTWPEALMTFLTSSDLSLSVEQLLAGIQDKRVDVPLTRDEQDALEAALVPPPDGEIGNAVTIEDAIERFDSTGPTIDADSTPEAIAIDESQVNEVAEVNDQPEIKDESVIDRTPQGASEADAVTAVLPTETPAEPASLAIILELAGTTAQLDGEEQSGELYDAIASQLQAVGEQAAEMGLLGIWEVCSLVHDSLQDLIINAGNLEQGDRGFLQVLALLLQDCLEQPQDPAVSQALFDALDESTFIAHLAADELEVLREYLLATAAEAATAPELDRAVADAVSSEVVEPSQLMDDASPVETPPADVTSAGAGDSGEHVPASVPAGSEMLSREAVIGEPSESEGPAAMPEPVSGGFPDDPVAEKQGFESVAVPRHAESASEPAPTAPDRDQAAPRDRQESTACEVAAIEAGVPMEARAADRDIEPGTYAALSEQQRELVEILGAELEEIMEASEATLAVVTTAGQPGSERTDRLEYIVDQAGHITNAAEMVGLEGLQVAARHIRHNLAQLAARDEVITDLERPLLENWPVRIHDYLQDMFDRARCERLVTMLQQAQWPEPLATGEGTKLIGKLQNPVIAEDSSEPRQILASPEDVSLTLPDDVSPELLDGMLTDLPSQTEEFSAAILRLAQGGLVSDIDTAQRIAHTVKGAGNVVGVNGIANLTHHLEDVLQALASHQAMPTPSLTDTLIGAADCLEAMSEALQGQSEPPQHAREILQEVLDWANRIDRDGIPRTEAAATDPDTIDGSPAGAPMPEVGIDTPASEEPMADNGRDEGTTAGVAAVNSQTTAEANLRIPATLVDEMMRLAGETMIATGQLQEQIQQSISGINALNTHNNHLQQLAFDLEQLVDVRGISSHINRRAAGSDFDSLEMDQYDELHTFSRKLIEATSDSLALTRRLEERLTELEQISISQDRLHKDNQDIVMRTRMVPVSTIAPRLKRGVRQACRLTGRKVELTIEGADTLMDSDVLNELLDPLMHMLRNAVDHGIESPAERTQLGKAPTGSIRLMFGRLGDQITVHCQDDGRGLDYPRIRQTAIERGLIPAGDEWSDDQLARLILQPGFSTRTEVTQTSGRGIGLDAVNARVRAMKGTLQLSSEQGAGARIELALPVSLLSAHSILVRTGKDMVAISNRGVEEILYSTADELRTFGNDTLYQAGEEFYAVKYLNTILGVEAESPGGQESQPLLLVRDEAGVRTAIIVQEVLASRNLVVKSLGRYVPKVRGIIGATILGDGSIAPVLDLPEFLQLSMAARRDVRSTEAAGISQRAQRPPFALVVDDSLSARRSLVQFVQDVGYDVRSARDGVEAVEIIQSRTPDILLADLEMPRMNGLELTSHLRANEDTRDLPVIMITSRSTEKHQTQAKTAGVSKYMVKPFSEDELLHNMQSALAEHR